MQVHLAQNRNDLALKEVSAARRWAQDNLLVNLAEAWVGVRLVSDASPFLIHPHPLLVFPSLYPLNRTGS